MGLRLYKGRHLALQASGVPLSALVRWSGVIGCLGVVVSLVVTERFLVVFENADFLVVWFGLIQKKIVFKN